MRSVKRVENNVRGRCSAMDIESKFPQIILIVFMVLQLALALLPIFITVNLSFKDAVGIQATTVWSFPRTWLFSNYAKAFDGMFGYELNSVFIVTVTTVLVIFISCYIAYLFVRKNFPLKSVLFFLIILPMLIPSVITLTPSYLVVFNLGLKWNWPGLILYYVAGSQIANIFMLRVFLNQQPGELYEAARIDGDGDIGIFFHLCLPLSYPIMMVQAIGIFGGLYNDYLWPLLMFNGSSNSTLMPVLQQVSDRMADGSKYAAYLISGIPLVITTVISLKFFVNGEFASGLKI